MYLLLLTSLVAVLLSGADAGGSTYVPPYPKVDISVRYSTQGLVNYLYMRCSFGGLPNVTPKRFLVMGSQPRSNRTYLYDLAQVIGAGGFYTAISTGMTLKGTADCENRPNAGCRPDEVAYAEWTWTNPGNTWDSPVFEKYGCNFYTEYSGQQSITQEVYPVRMREDSKNGKVDPSITSDKIHFRLRGGMGYDGTVTYLYMRCGATAQAGKEITAIEIFKPSGGRLAGVDAQGNTNGSEGERTRVDSSIDCDDVSTGCYGNEKAFLGVIWRKMDASRDVGADIDGDFYSLRCKVSAVSNTDQAVTYEQTRNARVSGGLGTVEKRIISGTG